LSFLKVANLIISSATLFILVKDKLPCLADIPQVPPPPQVPPQSQVSEVPDISPDVDVPSLHLSRNEQERVFDARIARLKSEVSSRQSAPIHTPTVAAILDPNVYNLPHDVIPSDHFPDEEVSE